MSPAEAQAAWRAGRFDARAGPRNLLFGRVYEDAAIELRAFEPGGRVFCIASAGCTAIQLAVRHSVVAVDINPVQIEYVRARITGLPARRGAAERLIAVFRALAPLAGWRTALVREFLALDDPLQQTEFWRRHLDTRRFRMAFSLLLSFTALRAVYASPLLASLPTRLGSVMRRRMERCFAMHSNRRNPYAWLLLLGAPADEPLADTTVARRSTGEHLRLECADAAEFLERSPPESFNGFSLSNILDGASVEYEERLFRAVRHAAAPDAMVVLRSFREPPPGHTTNHAGDDRSMIWGIVDVRRAAAL